MLMTWLRRADCLLLTSVSPADMARNYGGTFTDQTGAAVSNADWLFRPDLSAVIGQPSRYWLVSGDTVSLMDQSARDALDAALLEAARDAAAAQLDHAEDVLRACLQVLRDELNSHADKINAILTAVDGATTLANLKTAVAAIPDYPQRTLVQLRNAVRGKLGT